MPHRPALFFCCRYNLALKWGRRNSLLRVFFVFMLTLVMVFFSGSALNHLLAQVFCMFPVERFFQKLDPPISLIPYSRGKRLTLLWSGFIGRKITKKGEKGCYQPSHLMAAGKWNEGGRNFFVPAFLIQSFGVGPEVEMNFSFPSVFKQGPLKQKWKNNNGNNLKFDFWSIMKSGRAAASTFTSLNRSNLRKGTTLWKPE